MLNFRPVTLADKPWIDELVFAESSKSAGFNFGNIYMWDKFLRQYIARLNDRMILKYRFECTPFYAYPIGRGDPQPALEAMREYAQARAFPLCIRAITAPQREQLESLYPDRFTFEEDRKSFDYIYSAEALATLSGKKLHGKRNHINRFETSYSWRFEELSPAHFPSCLELLEQWTDASVNGNEGAAEEHEAILRCFEAWDVLGQEGGALFADGRLVAFTVGELITGDTFNVHFEKAYSDVNGAYPMVNREFIRQVLLKHPEICYVNREEDMGYENLRRAKMSYYPLFMVEKYTAYWRD